MWFMIFTGYFQLVECVRLDRLPLGKGARAPRQGGTLRTGQSGFVGGA